LWLCCVIIDLIKLKSGIDRIRRLFPIKRLDLFVTARNPIFKETVEKQRPSFMKDAIRKNLIDILQAAEEMQRFTQGMNFREDQNVAITQRTDERDLRLSGKPLAG